MKIQACEFQLKNEPWERGIAFLTGEFGVYDIKFIIDKDGKRLPEVWNYRLMEGIGKHIDTGL